MHRTFVSVQEVDQAGMELVNGNMVVMHVSQTCFFSQPEHSPSGSGGAPSPGPDILSAARAARGNSRKVAIEEVFMVTWPAKNISLCIWKWM